jgi:hypothetical protein
MGEEPTMSISLDEIIIMKGLACILTEETPAARVLYSTE